MRPRVRRTQGLGAPVTAAVSKTVARSCGQDGAAGALRITEGRSVGSGHARARALGVSQLRADGGARAIARGRRCTSSGGAAGGPGEAALARPAGARRLARAPDSRKTIARAAALSAPSPPRPRRPPDDERGRQPNAVTKPTPSPSASRVWLKSPTCGRPWRACVPSAGSTPSPPSACISNSAATGRASTDAPNSRPGSG